MVASRQDIQGWFEEGVNKGHKYMIVFCDTFDWDDYPAYYDTEKAAREAKSHPGEMQKVMEVYDLSGDKEAQMKAYRAMAL